MAHELVVGDEVVLHISTAVREDAITLYGLSVEAGTFQMLREVNGVGPRTALGILSQMDRAALHAAIGNEEIAKLTKLKGLGKKTAERLVLELKNKIPKALHRLPRLRRCGRPCRWHWRNSITKTEIDRAMSSDDVPAMDEAPVGACKPRYGYCPGPYEGEPWRIRHI